MSSRTEYICSGAAKLPHVRVGFRERLFWVGNANRRFKSTFASPGEVPSSIRSAYVARAVSSDVFPIAANDRSHHATVLTRLLLPLTGDVL